MTVRFILTGIAVALASCAQNVIQPEGPGPSERSTGLVTQADRVTDSRIAADRKTMEALQLRLRRLNESGVSQSNYSLAKAQCWLDTAWAQYHENDRTGYIEESLAEAQKIALTLEADKSAKAGYDTPMVARSTLLRNDLWAQLSALKMKETSLACYARTVACGEVRLVRAGHAEQQTGWRQAVPHVLMVEDAIKRAEAEAAQCAVVAATVSAPTAQPALVKAVETQPIPSPGLTSTKTKELFVIQTDTFFSFDQTNSATPSSLEKIAARLKSYKSVDALIVIGHTDRIGSDAYNDALSSSRAKWVMDRLQSMGVKAATYKIEGAGKRQPVTTECGNALSKSDLIQCLQPDRRVTIEVTGQVQ